MGLRKEGHPFWPNNEEVDSMKPHWDALFEAFASSEYVKKALSWLSDQKFVIKADPIFYIKG
ncbi:hypothetical protein EBR03_09420 [bacterium]|nr:hypothetical protein [bacterium]